jgi:hypothetical protein
VVNHDIVPVHLAVTALRDSGYLNATNAIAELIDNSIQAGATSIELLCAETEQTVNTRRRSRIHQIAVLDNGCGMSSDVLRAALQFGNGSFLQDRSGIGRFGMGLPNSSLSQANRVDVWTWQDGRQPAYSYLDYHEIKRGDIREVPPPSARDVPAVWKAAAQRIGGAGTLVVWSDIDIERCQWGTARAIINNSELTIGRIYRRFIGSGQVSIRLAAFNYSNPTGFTIDRLAEANDPCYLMSRTCCPEPWDSEPMFEAWGEPTAFTVEHDGRTFEVNVRFSIAKRVAREGYNPGRRDHGQHAARNVGVSIMRADRELELQLDWTTRHDPRERWWGAEVQFPPELDELFGVTNNKQSARTLAEYARLELQDIVDREGFESVQQLKEAWTNEGDRRLVVLEVKQHLDSNLAAIRQTLQGQTARARSGERHRDSAEEKGTEATRKRMEDGHHGESDDSEGKSVEVKEAEVESELRDWGLDPTEAGGRAREIVRDGRKYAFVHAPVDTDAFFSVRPRGGVILINLNTEHPAYQHLVALLDPNANEGDPASVRNRMIKSYEGLKLLLEAWARYEDELPLQQKDRARQARADWGRVARQFLAEG